MTTNIDQKTEIKDQRSEVRTQALPNSAFSIQHSSFTLPSIPATDKTFLPQAQHAMDNKTKTVGSLGKLEDIAIKCALIQKTVKPTLKNCKAIVFAADHGIAIEGISAYPAEVTPQMCINFLNGGAAINAICNSTGAGLDIVNMGVNYDFSNEPKIIDRVIRKGTSNFAVELAMTKAEAESAIAGGMSAFEEIYNNEKIDIVAIGEMGIGNTSSATAITATICDMPVSEVTGRGTGLDDVGLLHKQKVISKALDFHKPIATDPIDILSKVGGFEIAGMAGAMLKAASLGTVVVVDGFISTSAALIAQLLCPSITDYMIAGHKSIEKGQIAALKKLNLTPILDLGMRLGEGTGAALTMNLAVTATDILQNMASFEEAGVSQE